MTTVHVFEPPDDDRIDRNMWWRGDIRTNIDIFDIVLFADLDCCVDGYNILISNTQQDGNIKDYLYCLAVNNFALYCTLQCYVYF
jgi:hypothetical protein